MTDKEQLIERIKSLPADPEWKGFNPGIPIPLGKGVLVRKIETSVITKTEAGILLASGENTPNPHLGIIEAVGPLCSEFLKIGIRCYFNFYVDSSFYLNGINYWKMDENDVFYLVPPNVALMEAPNTAAHVRREKKQGHADGYLKRKYDADQKEKDDKDFKSKSGKIKIMKP